MSLSCKRSLKFCRLLKSNCDKISLIYASDTTNRLITTAFGFHNTGGIFMLTSHLTGKIDASEFKFANAGSSC